ncbi:efflux RND transporter periplasmic adaptor subunit [Burkholderiaceae bacterium DAT-1]|nr:efflux RND transporter periplasmic adaptor subunit [Burkholderiaceae bacterium DAT-1]
MTAIKLFWHQYQTQARIIVAMLVVALLLAGWIVFKGKPAIVAEAEDEHEVAGSVVTMNSQDIQANAIQLDTARAMEMADAVSLTGEVRLNDDRTAHVVPRVGGVVERVLVSLGKQVKQGDVLAVITSPQVAELRSELRTARQRLALARTTHDREKRLWEQGVSAEQDYLQASQALREAELTQQNALQKLVAQGLDEGRTGDLSRVALRAPMSGTVIEKHLSAGEAVQADAAAFTVADLKQVWVELNVAAKDLALIREGSPVSIRASGLAADAQGRVTFVGALVGEQSRTAIARVVLDNPDGHWRPGLFVSAEVAGETRNRPVTVAADAVHQLSEQSVVFVRTKTGFIAQTIKPGIRANGRVEILAGLQAGAAYAAAGSFVLKSELGKSSAAHAH